MSAPCPAFGFTVRIAPETSTSEADADRLVDDLLELLAAHDLSTDGGGRPGDKHAPEYVVAREGSPATHQDRELVLQWARRWSPFAKIDVGDLVDLSDV